MCISFEVSGIPAPGGSKRFVGIGKKTGRAIIIDAGGQRTKDWRTAVSWAAKAVGSKELLRCALAADFVFTMPRPKSHYHTSKAKFGLLREDAPVWHTIRPDALKLARSTEDAITGILWADDALIAKESFVKVYGDRPGAKISISVL